MMQIDSANLYYESITSSKSIDAKSQKVYFEEVMNSEVKKIHSFKNSIEELVKSIELNHNAKITISSDSFSANSTTELNNVIIGGDTLDKMKNNSVFREKIMKVIDECCSYSNQEKIKSLSPPVKNAGVIIYPDASYLCWLESIHSDNKDVKRDTASSDSMIIKDIKNAKKGMIENIVEQFNNCGLVPNIHVDDKKRSK